MQPNFHVIFTTGSRSKAALASHFHLVSVRFSEIFGKVLAFWYDDQNDYRWSCLYLEGIAESAWGENDELWVEVDEEAEPLMDLPPKKLKDLDPDIEYATIKNAIDFGLEAFGGGSWDGLFDVLLADEDKLYKFTE